MASKIVFTLSEKQWLIHLLDNRLFQYKYSDVVPEKIIDLAKACRIKLLKSEIVFFGPNQAALCTGCVNEQMESYSKELTIKVAYDLLYMTDEQKYLTSQIDMGKDMLVKLGYDKKEYIPTYNYKIRYCHTLDAIDKIRHAEKICLSKTNEHVYKIGFVTKDQEVFTWKLSHDLEVHDIKTFPKEIREIKDYVNGFMLVTDRQHAVEILIQYPYEGYNASAFFKEVLH